MGEGGKKVRKDEKTMMEYNRKNERGKRGEIEKERARARRKERFR